MTFDQSIRVYVQNSDFGMTIDIAVVQEVNGATRSLTCAKVTERGELLFDPSSAVRDFQPVMPTLRLSRELAEQLLKGLLELRIPSPSAGAIEGELKATKMHLEDMRKLVLKDRA